MYNIIDNFLSEEEFATIQSTFFPQDLNNSNNFTWNYQKGIVRDPELGPTGYEEHYGLTDEQMKDIDVHHNPPRCEGGRNIPEHLYIYSPELHAAVHETESVLWARKGYETRKKNGTENKKGIRTGGGPSKKTEPTQQELAILKYRQSGMSRKEVADLLGLKEHQVKRAVRECSKFGYELHLKSGPKKGCEGKSHTEEAKQKIKEKRAQQVFSQESLDKRSESMKKHCQSHTWSRRKPKRGA